MTVSLVTNRASSATAKWAGFGLAASTFERRHSYHPHTNAGSLRNASAVANTAGSKRSHKPVKASRNVGMPLSAETPAPVNTTTWEASRKRYPWNSIMTSSYLRNRANHSANVRSIILAGCRVNASFPHFSHRSHQSPGPRASLSGATVFFQPHLPQTNVKGLGLMGMSLLLCYARFTPQAARPAEFPPCAVAVPHEPFPLAAPILARDFPRHANSREFDAPA